MPDLSNSPETTIDIKSTHRQAMASYDKGLALSNSGDFSEAATHFRESYLLESTAARAVEVSLSSEPTRSVLFRSAATIGVECGDITGAIRLAFEGLHGADAEIALELRDIIKAAQAKAADMPAPGMVDNDLRTPKVFDDLTQRRAELISKRHAGSTDPEGRTSLEQEELDVLNGISIEYIGKYFPAPKMERTDSEYIRKLLEGDQ